MHHQKKGGTCALGWEPAHWDTRAAGRYEWFGAQAYSKASWLGQISGGETGEGADSCEDIPSSTSVVQLVWAKEKKYIGNMQEQVRSGQAKSR